MEREEDDAGKEGDDAGKEGDDAGKEDGSQDAPSKSWLNVVFIGHVDAGKSTIAGHLLRAVGKFSERDLHRAESEAATQAGVAWKFAYLMDTNDEERLRGKTMEVGVVHFDTRHRRCTLLDAPGHCSRARNTIEGITQADLAVVVLSARRGEFESGFDRGGQTREHLLLAHAVGVHRFVLAVNKMDDPSVAWDRSRYDDIVAKVSAFCKSIGIAVETKVHALPVSGYRGTFLADDDGTSAPIDVCPWYRGPSLLGLLDSLPLPPRRCEAPLRLVVQFERRTEGKRWMEGRVEYGTVAVGQRLRTATQPHSWAVEAIRVHEDLAAMRADAGQRASVMLASDGERRLAPGDVLVDACDDSVRCAKKFEADLFSLDLLQHKPIITAGYRCILHCQLLTTECVVVGLRSRETDGKPMKVLRANRSARIVLRMPEAACVEPFARFSRLGRFVLRDEGRTIGVGRVTRLL